MRRRSRKKGSPTYVRDMEKIVALGLVFGYLDVGILEFERGGFTFTIRGPVWWRLTSGLPPFLHRPSTGIAREAYLRIEALLAYLLLTEQATVVDASVASSTIVWTISSKWFQWHAIQNFLQDNDASFRIRRAVLMLLNVSIGLGLVLKKLPFALTAVGYTRNLSLRFYTSASPLQRTARVLPSKLTLPRMSAALYWMGVIVGILLIGQQARIKGLLVDRGGLIGFGIMSNVFEFHALPRIIEQWRSQSEAADEGADEGADDAPSAAEPAMSEPTAVAGSPPCG